jgi:hypothetical protein
MNKLKKAIHSKSSYAILDKSLAGECTFQSGGCLILAEALSMYMDVPVYVVYNKTLQISEHFFVKMDQTLFFDSDGLQTGKKMLKKISEEIGYGGNILVIMEFNDKISIGNIPRDLESSKELAEFFTTETSAEKPGILAV